MTKIYLPIAEINVIDNQRWLNKHIEFQEFIGFDTETYKGACKLLADSTGRYIYNPDFKECIDFLWYKASIGYYRSFWNMDFDISAILKLYDDIDFIDDLIHGIDVKYNDYTLTYLRPKFFSIRKGHKRVAYTDLFYMYKLSLNKASETFLNQSKTDNIDGNMLNTSLPYWIKNLTNIIIYCIQDAKLTASLGNYLYKKIKQAGLHAPKYFSSHASLSKQYYRLNSRIPSIKYIPTNILDIGYNCYYGGRFEVLQRGFFPNLYNYDINSAYPDTIKDLPSLKFGKWYKTYKPAKKETIGFYKVLIDIPESYISAYPIKHKGLVIFPHGIFQSWISWYELDLLRKYISKFYYGYEYESDKKREYYPFRKQTEYLYSKKAEFKNINEVFYWIFKIVMNALYGCFIERHKKPNGNIESGVLFNPVYASIITARTRWKLLKDTGKKNWNNIIAFHTDSVITNKPLNNLTIDNKIGNWSFDNEKELDKSGVILASGIYQIGSKVRRRGFAKKDINWFDKLKEFSKETSIEIPKIHVIKIAEALRRWHSTEKVNIFIQDYKKFKINSDKKRKWIRNFENCNDVLNNSITSSTLGFKYISEKELI